MAVFKIEGLNPTTGEKKHFIYDSSKSTFVDAKSGRSAVPVVGKSDRVAALVTSVNEPLGKTSPKTLKISMGLSCNYSCEYCSQRFVPRADETNPKDVDVFVGGLDEWVKTPPEKIEFWGGEPLVYIKTLKPLAEALRAKYPDATFLVITNGSLLTKELNAWLDEMNFNVAVSHDGPGQYVRGPDPLDDPKVKEAILDLYKTLGPKRMSFNSMINRQNKSRAAVVQFFQELTGDPDVCLGEGGLIDAYDEGGMANSLNADEQHFYRNLAFSEIRAGKSKNFFGISQKIGSFVNSLRMQRDMETIGQKCGMDRPENMAVDMRGNVITCQNVSVAGVAPNGESHHLGNVSDMANVKLKTSTHWSLRDECPKCPMIHICSGSCMFLEGPLWETSCDNAYSDAVPVFAASIEFLTGFVPMRIEGPHRADRHDLWKSAVQKRRVIPITVTKEAA